MSTTSALGNVIPPANPGISSALGNLATRQLQPSTLGFENFLPTGMTSSFSGEVASLSSGNASAGLASSSASSVQNSDLPSAVILQPAKITGTGAALAADAPASVVGTSALPANLASDTSFTINGTTVNLTSGMTPAQIVQAINTANNGQPPTGLASASLDSSNDLVLTGADAKTSITISGLESGALAAPALGLADGTTTPTNLLTQKAVSAGQTLTITIGSNPPLTITFGTDSGDVATLADLSSKLGTLVGGIASVDANGDISITAGSPFDTITVGGTASAATFGIQTTTAAPPDQLVVNNNSPTNPNNAPPPPTNSPTNPSNAPPPTNEIWWGSSGSGASNTTSTNMPMTLGNEMAASSSNSSSGNTSMTWGNEIGSPTSVPTTGASGTSTNASMPWGNEIAANSSGPPAEGFSNALTANLINSYSASALYVTLSSKLFDGLA
jgi:hypothetical protein